MSHEHVTGCPGRAAAATRGQLRIYLGSAPGAGTTYAMLSEARLCAQRGTDVVVADVKTHGRPRTARALPRFSTALRSSPSPRDVVKKITGVPPHQTVPDAFVRAADEAEIVDMTPEALRDRMAHGDIYPAAQAQAALAGWFRIGNLAALRELALLWLAGALAEDRHRYRPGGPLPGRPEHREKVVVALSGGPDDETLIRRAAQITARTAGDVLAVHITRPARPAGTGRAATLTAHRRLVNSAGGTYHQLSDDDIPAALLTFARAENATQLVLGATRRSWRPALLPGTAIRSRVLRAATGIDVHIVTCTQIPRDTPPTAPVRESRRDSSEDGAAPVLSRWHPAAVTDWPELLPVRRPA